MENKYRYKLIGARFALSFAGSFYINIGGHLDLVRKAIITPMFYVAFLVSVGICYLLLYLIDFVTELLDKQFPWKRQPFIRLQLQLALGILLPVLVHLILIYLYFMVTDRFFMFAVFIKNDYLVVLVSIILLNILPLGKRFTIAEKNVESQANEYLPIKHNGVELSLHVPTEVLYIHKENRKVKIVMVNGETCSETFTINYLIEKFSNCGLCQVNPSTLANLHMVIGSVAGTRLKTLEPIFKPQFHDQISPSDLQKLIVTRKFIRKFRDEMKKYRTG